MDSFFGVGLPELILILVIAGVVMGPERIIQIARWLGKTTAQLQAISRAFVRQINSELDGVDDGALRNTAEEMQKLKKELEALRSDFIMTTSDTRKMASTAVKEVENSIAPEGLKRLAVPAENGNGRSTPTPTPASAQSATAVTPHLPKPIDVADDPES